MLPFPDNLVTVRIDPNTGERADPLDPKGIFELFREEFAPDPATQTQNETDQVHAQDIF